MADNLKESLEKGEVDRLKDFKAMMGNIKKGINDMEDYVAKKLKEFSDAHAEMSEQQKKDLAKYVAGIVAETKRVLRGFADESEKMAGNWQAMAATMAKRRGGRPVVSAGAKVETVEEAVKKPRKRGRKKGKGKKKR
jgi:Sec-independent protein translocase protein TatA